VSVALLAVDGGNSKTDVALVGDDGSVLHRARGPGSSPHALGVAGSIAVIEATVEVAVGEAASAALRPIARHGAFFLAGVDQPHEEVAFREALRTHGVVGDASVTNDTFAVLHAGTDREWGVAVVCGAGINASGIAPDGTSGRYQALGELSGDWGGGFAVGLAALGAAIRGNDGRGAPTVLSTAIPEHFRQPTAEAVADAIHRLEIDQARLVELAPVVLESARSHDTVAASIVDRLGDEVAVMATALLSRLGMVGAGADVVLGGGVLQSGDARLLRRVVDRIAAVDPSARARPLQHPPLLGAVRAGLRAMGAPPAAQERAGIAFETAPMGDLT